MVKLAIDKSDSRWIKKSQKGPCFKMERHPAYYEKHNKTTGGPDMKMLKKLAALILAATMVLVLFTACGGDTPSTPEAQAEAQMMSTINAKRGSAAQLCNDTELKQEAEKFLDSAVDINTGAWKIYNAIDVHRDDNGVYTAKVVVKNEYTGKLLEEFFKLVNNKDKDVNINAVGKWTKVGVAAKTVKGNMYISVVVQVNPNA